MRIIIKGHKGLKIDGRLRAYIDEKIRKFESMVSEPANGAVTLFDISGPKRGTGKVVKIALSLPRKKTPIYVSCGTTDFYRSIDLAQERLEQQILKYKEKTKIGRRLPAKYHLSRLYEAGRNGPRWLMRKIRKSKK